MDLEVYGPGGLWTWGSMTWGSPHHCGVPTADEMSDLEEDALAAVALVQRASLHDDRHGQQDLLTHVLLQAGGRERGGIMGY